MWPRSWDILLSFVTSQPVNPPDYFLGMPPKVACSTQGLHSQELIGGKTSIALMIAVADAISASIAPSNTEPERPAVTCRQTLRNPGTDFSLVMQALTTCMSTMWPDTVDSVGLHCVTAWVSLKVDTTHHYLCADQKFHCSILPYACRHIDQYPDFSTQTFFAISFKKISFEVQGIPDIWGFGGRQYQSECCIMRTNAASLTTAARWLPGSAPSSIAASAIILRASLSVSFTSKSRHARLRAERVIPPPRTVLGDEIEVRLETMERRAGGVHCRAAKTARTCTIIIAIIIIINNHNDYIMHPGNTHYLYRCWGLALSILFSHCLPLKFFKVSLAWPPTPGFILILILSMIPILSSSGWIVFLKVTATVFWIVVQTKYRCKKQQWAYLSVCRTLPFLWPAWSSTQNNQPLLFISKSSLCVPMLCVTMRGLIKLSL